MPTIRVIWPFRWNCSTDSFVQCMLHNSTWLGRVLEYQMCCCDHHVEYPVRYLGWNLYLFPLHNCPESGHRKRWFQSKQQAVCVASPHNWSWAWQVCLIQSHVTATCSLLMALQDDCHAYPDGFTACGFLLWVWVQWGWQNGLKKSFVIGTAYHLLWYYIHMQSWFLGSCTSHHMARQIDKARYPGSDSPLLCLNGTYVHHSCITRPEECNKSSHWMTGYIKGGMLKSVLSTLF